MTIIPTPHHGIAEPRTPFLGEHGWPVELQAPIRIDLSKNKHRTVILTHPGMSDE